MRISGKYFQDTDFNQNMGYQHFYFAKTDNWRSWRSCWSESILVIPYVLI